VGCTVVAAAALANLRLS